MKSITVVLAVVALFISSCAREVKVGPEEARAIARDAYIYGLPIVENYKVMYTYAVYRQSGSFKAPFNRLAIVTPDTSLADSLPQVRVLTPPYALSWMDLRKEPVVITVSAMEEGSDFHVQLVDLYTHNFDEISTRTTGNAGGNYLIAPAQWSGETPAGIAKVIPCETLVALAIIRPAESRDLVATERFLDHFNVQTLSEFEAQRPKTPDALIFPPYSRETARSAGFFQYLNFALQFCPVHPSEVKERARFAKLGIAAGKSFNVATADPDLLKAINDGIADAKEIIAEDIGNTPIEAAKYGSRAELKNDYLGRAVAAGIQLYGPPLQ